MLFLKRDSTLMVTLAWLAQLVLVNVHWLSVSGLFWLLLAVQSMLTVPQMIVLSPLLAAAAFSLLLPASAAMFQDVHAWQEIKPLRWRSFVKNWWQELREHAALNALGALVLTIAILYWRLFSQAVFARALILGILATVLASALNRWARGQATATNRWHIGRGLLSAIVVLVVLGLTFQLQWGFVFLLMGGSVCATVSCYLLK